MPAHKSMRLARLQIGDAASHGPCQAVGIALAVDEARQDGVEVGLAFQHISAKVFVGFELGICGQHVGEKRFKVGHVGGQIVVIGGSSLAHLCLLNVVTSLVWRRD